MRRKHLLQARQIHAGCEGQFTLAKPDELRHSRQRLRTARTARIVSAMLTLVVVGVFVVGCCGPRGSYSQPGFAGVPQAIHRSVDYALPLSATARAELVQFMAASGNRAVVDDDPPRDGQLKRVEATYGPILDRLQRQAPTLADLRKGSGFTSMFDTNNLPLVVHDARLGWDGNDFYDPGTDGIRALVGGDLIDIWREENQPNEDITSVVRRILDEFPDLQILEHVDEAELLLDWVNVWATNQLARPADLKHSHRFLPGALELADGLRQGRPSALDSLDLGDEGPLPDLRAVVIGHTHHARISVHRDTLSPDRDLVLMDCGAWIESCRFVGDRGAVPSCQVGILCGGDARIYQLDPIAPG